MENHCVDAEPGAAALAAQRLAAELLQSDSIEVLAALAETAARLEDTPLGEGVLAALHTVTDPAGLDALWSAWQRTGSPALSSLLKEKNMPAGSPLALHIRSALFLGRTDLLEQAGPQWVAPLLELGDESDPHLADAARRAVGRLKTIPAQEELCRWVTEHDHPLARAACLEHGIAPHQPLPRALFYILTEQWEAYEALDFDTRLLKAVYAAVDPAVRRKIAEAARRRGWVHFVEAAARRTVQRLGELSQAEWQVIVSLLSSHRRYQEMWDLAQASPPVWAARLLRDLHDAGWSLDANQPGGEADASGDEAGRFNHLVDQAWRCLDAGLPQEQLAHSPRLLAGHRRLVTALAATPAGDMLASAGADRLVQLWQLPAGELLHTLDGHTGYVSALAISPDGSVIASGSGDRTVRLWRLPSGEPGLVLGGHAGEVTAVSISPDGALLASADQRVIWLWRLSDGALLNMLKGHTSPIPSLAFTPGSRYLVSCSEDGALHIWDAQAAAQGGEAPAPTILMEQVGAWRLSPGGEHLFTASKYGILRQWSVPGGEALRSLPERADGRLLLASGESLAASHRSLLRVWPLSAQADPVVVEVHTAPVTALAAHPSAEVFASGDQGQQIFLWRPYENPPAALVPPPVSTPGASPSARLPTAASTQAHPISQLLFGPRGDVLLAASERDLWLWQLQDLTWLYRLPSEHLDSEILRSSQRALDSAPEAGAERLWLAFAQDLSQWRHRYDIEVAPAPRQIQLGEFDIEIESVGG